MILIISHYRVNLAIFVCIMTAMIMIIVIKQHKNINDMMNKTFCVQS